MKWVAYLAQRSSPKKGEYDSAVRRFEIDSEDSRDAVAHAAKTYKVKADRILCLPDKSDVVHEGVKGVMTQIGKKSEQE